VTTSETRPILNSSLSLAGLAAALQLTPRELRTWAFSAQSGDLYARFAIRKRSGGSRLIVAPKAPLRMIQRRILRLLYQLDIPAGIAHGLTGSRSIVTNAGIHCRRQFVLNLDLKDFYPSINFGRVRGALMARPASLASNVATVLARLTCFDDQLPQGAPTSAFLANLVCRRLDRSLLRMAKFYNCTCTRYSDDITVSTRYTRFPEALAFAVNPPFGTGAVIGESLAHVIESNGFRINDQKTRLAGKLASQRVTGLAVNEKLNVNRRLIREIRGMIYAWETHGLAAAEQVFVEKYATRHRSPTRAPPSFKRSLVGKLQFMAMVKGGQDPAYLKLARRCRVLDSSLFPRVAM